MDQDKIKQGVQDEVVNKILEQMPQLRNYPETMAPIYKRMFVDPENPLESPFMEHVRRWPSNSETSEKGQTDDQPSSSQSSANVSQSNPQNLRQLSQEFPDVTAPAKNE